MEWRANRNILIRDKNHGGGIVPYLYRQNMTQQTPTLGVVSHERLIFPRSEIAAGRATEIYYVAPSGLVFYLLISRGLAKSARPRLLSVAPHRGSKAPFGIAQWLC